MVLDNSQNIDFDIIIIRKEFIIGWVKKTRENTKKRGRRKMSNGLQSNPKRKNLMKKNPLKNKNLFSRRRRFNIAPVH